MKRFRLLDKVGVFCVIACFAALTVSCGSAAGQVQKERADNSLQSEGDNSADGSSSPVAESDTDIWNSESASDGSINFEALSQVNGDLFAWIYIKDTGIDQPVLQCTDKAEDFYKDHDELGNQSDKGLAYTFFPNRKDFCDFNTVINGVDPDTILAYKDPEFFKKHKELEVYIDGNHMTYQVVMARSWEKTDILGQYAFQIPNECTRFLQETYDTRTLSDNVSEYYKELTYFDFIITLVADDPADPDKQYMVIACLVKDRNKTITYHVNEIPGLEGIDDIH